MDINPHDIKSKAHVRNYATQQLDFELADLEHTSIPDVIWQQAELEQWKDDEDYLADYVPLISACCVKGDPDRQARALDALIKFLQDRLEVIKVYRRSTSRQVKLNIGQPELSRYEQLRAEIFSAWLADAAEQSRAVTQQRLLMPSPSITGSDDVSCIPLRPLGDEDGPVLYRRTLTPDEATEFLRNLDCRGRPVSRQELNRYETLAWPPAGVEGVPVMYPDLEVYTSAEGESEAPYQMDGQLAADGTRLVFPRIGQLARMVRRARDVGRSYFWTPEQALWFILTGRYPVLPPITIGFRARGYEGFERGDQSYERGVLTIEVEPWVSPVTVLATYRAAQVRIGVKRRGSEDGLEAWRFATTQRASGLKRGVHNKWIETKHKVFRAKPHFSNAVRHARDTVLRPYRDES